MPTPHPLAPRGVPMPSLLSLLLQKAQARPSVPVGRGGHTSGHGRLVSPETPGRTDGVPESELSELQTGRLTLDGIQRSLVFRNREAKVPEAGQAPQALGSAGLGRS